SSSAPTRASATSPTSRRPSSPRSTASRPRARSRSDGSRPARGRPPPLLGGGPRPGLPVGGDAMPLATRPRFPTGIVYALAPAALFGASTPFAKLLVGQVDPVLLAGLLYLGSGCGLSAWRWLGSRRERESAEAPLNRVDWPWLAGAVLAGGVAGPA